MENMFRPKLSKTTKDDLTLAGSSEAGTYRVMAFIWDSVSETPMSEVIEANLNVG
jgi:hypothetical protein